jgi:hypothetical protein
MGHRSDLALPTEVSGSATDSGPSRMRGALACECPILGGGKFVDGGRDDGQHQDPSDDVTEGTVSDVCNWGIETEVGAHIARSARSPSEAQVRQVDVAGA